MKLSRIGRGHDKHLEMNWGRVKRYKDHLSNTTVHVSKEINKAFLQGKVLPNKLHDWVREAKTVEYGSTEILAQKNSPYIEGGQLKNMEERIIYVLWKSPFDHGLRLDCDVDGILKGQRKETKTKAADTVKKPHPEVQGEAAGSESTSLSGLEDRRASIKLTSSQRDKSKKPDVASLEYLTPSSSVKHEEKPHFEHEIIPSTATDSASMPGEDHIAPSAETSVNPTISGTTSLKIRWPQFLDTEFEIFQGDASIEVQDAMIKDPDNLFKESDYLLSIKTSGKIEDLPNMESDQGNILKNDALLHGPLENQKRTSILLPEHSLLQRAGAGLKEPPREKEWEQASVVVLANNEFSSLPTNPNCPNLKFLFLQRNNRLRTIPGLFFDDMASLRVLDLSKTRIKSLPSSLSKLTDLQVLLLRQCDCLDELPREVGDMQHIEVLDLWGTELYELPDEIGNLISLKILKTSFYGSDDQSEHVNLPAKLVSHGILSNFTAMQALSIVVHPKDRRWNNAAEAITNSVCMLENLTYLEFYFPDVKFLKIFTETSPSWGKSILNKFKFLVGQDIKRIVSRVPDDIESEYDLQDRCFRFVNGGGKPKEVIDVLKRATAFYLDHHLIICSLSEFGITNMKELKFCLVRECPNLRVLVDNEGRSEKVLQLLGHLSLHYLWQLEILWKGPVPRGSLRELKVLAVHKCPKLEFILSQSMIVEGLPNLGKLVVEDCASLKEIIKSNDDALEGDFDVFPCLKVMTLEYLPELVSVWSGVFPSLKEKRVHGCPKLKNFD